MISGLGLILGLGLGLGLGLILGLVMRVKKRLEICIRKPFLTHFAKPFRLLHSPLFLLCLGWNRRWG